MNPKFILLIHVLMCLFVQADGRNILVAELKASKEHELTEDDRDQAIRTPRILEGNIAPFAILTNGRRPEVYDVVDARQIDGEKIPVDHRYAKTGFCISCDDIALRAQALETLISPIDQQPSAGLQVPSGLQNGFVAGETEQ